MIYVLAPKENWICDRIASEWYEYFGEFSNEILSKFVARDEPEPAHVHLHQRDVFLKQHLEDFRSTP